jgi:catechol 2,3-dioxygenase-like lactoylglutathione lyase family enzyme
MEILRVVMQADRARLARLRAFYAEVLDLAPTAGGGIAVGAGELAFTGADEDAFHHFALLVPGDRFQAARAWAGSRVELLPGGDVDGVVFDFTDWDALACYFHDPAGNIVELIAHRGIGEQGRTGPFGPDELLGFSEVGLVGNPPALAADLAGLDLEVWDGTLDGGDRLAFVGERGRTLILAPAGRGWLPTGRPAAPFAVEVVLAGGPAGEVRTGGHTVRRVRG